MQNSNCKYQNAKCGGRGGKNFGFSILDFGLEPQMSLRDASLNADKHRNIQHKDTRAQRKVGLFKKRKLGDLVLKILSACIGGYRFWIGEAAAEAGRWAFGFGLRSGIISVRGSIVWGGEGI